MKKVSLTFILIITCIFTVYGCGCTKEETISKEEAIEILKENKVNENVEIVTTIETSINNNKTTSTQHDIYYNNTYYHLSENNGIATKTWYGKVGNVLYAFYYTKNANNQETKTSSRITETQLNAAKKQPNSVINSLFNESGNLSSIYDISATKKGSTYTIQASSNLEEESITHTITIKDNKIEKIITNSSIANDSIKITYSYNYDVEKIDLPSLNEYPLKVNG